MEATTRIAIEQPASDRTIERHVERIADVGEDRGRPAADLQRLMAIADRYARRLVAEPGSPSEVLLMVHDGDLEVVTLDCPDHDVNAVRRLLVQRQASSAALMVDVRSTSGEQADALFSILGETVDGVRDEWRYRVRPCGRGRRLTRLSGSDTIKVEEVPRRLFALYAATGTRAAGGNSPTSIGSDNPV